MFVLLRSGDFGHVTSVNVGDLEEGDCRYLPKEILTEDRTNLAKADIFSLGLIIFEVVSLALLSSLFFLPFISHPPATPLRHAHLPHLSVTSPVTLICHTSLSHFRHTHLSHLYLYRPHLLSCPRMAPTGTASETETCLSWLATPPPSTNSSR